MYFSGSYFASAFFAGSYFSGTDRGNQVYFAASYFPGNYFASSYFGAGVTLAPIIYPASPTGWKSSAQRIGPDPSFATSTRLVGQG